MKFSSEQRKQLQKAIHEFNKIIDEQIKLTGLDENIFPAKLSYSDFKKGINTDVEFNRELKAIQRIKKPGSLALTTTDKGALITNYELTELYRKKDIINKYREEQRKLIPENPYYYGVMGQIERNLYRPFKADFTSLSSSKLERYRKTLPRRAFSQYEEDRKKRYKENYYKAYRNVFGSIDKELLEALNSISIDDFSTMYYTNPFLSIDYIYDEKEIEVKKEKIRKEIMNYISQKY